jgi:predicted outer membrane lipoprotein
VAAAALHTDRQWVWWYAWLGGIVLLAMAFVAICAITGELGSVKYNLEQQIATENSRRADMVRSINMTGTYGNLRPTAGADKLTNQPAGVLKVKGCKALPPERLSVLSSAQPYCAHAPAAEGGGTGPALAGVYSP